MVYIYNLIELTIDSSEKNKVLYIDQTISGKKDISGHNHIFKK